MVCSLPTGTVRSRQHVWRMVSITGIYASGFSLVLSPPFAVSVMCLAPFVLTEPLA